jgi:hypothetical protein
MSTLTFAPMAVPAARPALRLTRRGQALGVVVLLVLLGVALIWGAGRSAQADGDATPVAPAAGALVTVHQGDTLWSIAKGLAPSRDPRAVVLAIRELNDLDSGAVHVGQQLVLPSVAG